MLNIGHGIPHSSCVLLGFRLYVSSAAAGLQYTPPVDFMWHASRLMIRIALQRAHFELTGSDAALHAQNPSPRKCAPRCSAGRAARHPATLACAPPPRPRPPRTPRAREAAARDRARLLSVLGAASADASTAARAMSALTSAQQESILQIIADSTSSGRLASGWEQMKTFLLGEQLAYNLQIPPPQMGTDVENRSGSLVNPTRAHNLGCKICAQGFVFAKTLGATAFEAPPMGGAAYDEVLAANDRLSRLSGGRCPPLSSLRYTSVGGSHTNVFLRCVIARSPTSVKAIADARGYIDSERLQSCQPELAEACSKGLTWLVIKYNVASITGMKSFVQRALNADVREAVHETEIIRIGCSRSA